MEDHLLAWPQLVDAGAQTLGAGVLSNPRRKDAVASDGERVIEIAHTRRVRAAVRPRARTSRYGLWGDPASPIPSHAAIAARTFAIRLVSRRLIAFSFQAAFWRARR